MKYKAELISADGLKKTIIVPDLRPILRMALYFPLSYTFAQLPDSMLLEPMMDIREYELVDHQYPSKTVTVGIYHERNSAAR